MQADKYKPPPDFDARMREWMAAQGWPVNSTRDYFDEGVYAWRHDLSSGTSPTLWIARALIDGHAAGKVAEQLDRLGVADRIRANPKARFVVTEEAGRITVKPWKRGE